MKYYELRDQVKQYEVCLTIAAAKLRELGLGNPARSAFELVCKSELANLRGLIDAILANEEPRSELGPEADLFRRSAPRTAGLMAALVATKPPERPTRLAVLALLLDALAEDLAASPQDWQVHCAQLRLVAGLARGAAAF